MILSSCEESVKFHSHTCICTCLSSPFPKQALHPPWAGAMAGVLMSSSQPAQQHNLYTDRDPRCRASYGFYSWLSRFYYQLWALQQLLLSLWLSASCSPHIGAQQLSSFHAHSDSQVLFQDLILTGPKSPLHLFVIFSLS